jgi:hypothetical protein
MLSQHERQTRVGRIINLLSNIAMIMHREAPHVVSNQYVLKQNGRIIRAANMTWTATSVQW